VSGRPEPDAFDLAADPDRLREFVTELDNDGFQRSGAFSWEGPTHPSLLAGGHTRAARMTVTVRPSWPYLPPLIHVPGITTWHADQERLCLWQADDASQRWTTLQGLYDRIEEWAADANRGFADVENARNPEIYWQQDIPRVAGLVEIDTVLGGRPGDGQHGDFHFTNARSADSRVSPVVVYDLHPGAFTASTALPDGIQDRRQVRARWYYRDTVPHPPRDIDEFRGFLTDKQRRRLDGDLRSHRAVMLGLFWRNQAGLVATVLLSAPRADGAGRQLKLVVLRPKGVDELLLRAGPDTTALAGTRVTIVGVGAIGSHVAEQLARAGVRSLKLYDHDLLWPANLIRHAAAPGTPAGTLKTHALKEQLEQYPWVTVDVPDRDHGGFMWTVADLRMVIEAADLTIDATAHGGLAELAARVAADADRAYLTVALFRGGAVARVRRQTTAADTPIAARAHLDAYPQIHPLDAEAEYVGTETGCLAQVHNAPPVAVAHAANVAANVAIDHLTGRHDQPDEVIEVIRPGDPPFDRPGRVRPEDLPVTVDMSERAQRAVRRAARGALPDETGGVLVGCRINCRTVVAEAIEITDVDADPRNYRVASGAAAAAIDDARQRDARVGHVGEWHSHTRSPDPSPLDVATMLTLAADSEANDTPVLIIAHPDPDGTDAAVDLRAYITTPAGLKPAAVATTGDLPDHDEEDR
jgi:proteasome lid subunit RPN8/RPN11